MSPLVRYWGKELKFSCLIRNCGQKRNNCDGTKKCYERKMGSEWYFTESLSGTEFCKFGSIERFFQWIRKLTIGSLTSNIDQYSSISLLDEMIVDVNVIVSLINWEIFGSFYCPVILYSESVWLRSISMLEICQQTWEPNAFFADRHMDMYSASHVEEATTVCFFDFQITAPWYQ